MQPATCHPQPSSSHPLPATRCLPPATRYQPPVTCHPLPVTRYLSPHTRGKVLPKRSGLHYNFSLKGLKNKQTKKTGKDTSSNSTRHTTGMCKNTSNKPCTSSKHSYSNKTQLQRSPTATQKTTSTKVFRNFSFLSYTIGDMP